MCCRVQVSKGLLQVAKALAFLHEDAKIIHGNLTLESVCVNARVRRHKLKASAGRLTP